MGFNFQNGSPDEFNEVEMHDINVTPFIDVMLVLLIVFMIAAPLSTVDIKVDLPSASATPSDNRPDEPVTLSVRRDGTLAVGDKEIPLDTLVRELMLASEGDKETRIFLRADKTLEYGDLMSVMNTIRRAGFLKVALVSQESAEQGPK